METTGYGISGTGVLVLEDVPTYQGVSTSHGDLENDNLVYFYKITCIRYPGVSSPTVRKVTMAGVGDVYTETQPGDNQEFVLDLTTATPIYLAWQVKAGLSGIGPIYEPGTDSGGTIVINYPVFPELPQFTFIDIS